MATEIIETTPPLTEWTIDKARSLYNIEGWGAGFFDIDERGHVASVPTASTPSGS
jgi:arginine decarboxylase